MRKRLIKLLLNCYDDANLQYYDLTEITDKFMGGAEYLADYLLKNGVVVLPVKIGDIVYTTYGGNLSEYKVKSFIINDFCWAELVNKEYVEEYKLIKSCISFDFGKTVFLTKEEAEKHLKGVSNDKLRTN